MVFREEVIQTFERVAFIQSFAAFIARDRRLLEVQQKPNLTPDQIKVATPLVIYGTLNSASYPWGFQLNGAHKLYPAYLSDDTICVDIFHDDGPQDSILIPLRVFQDIFEEMKSWQGNEDLSCSSKDWSGRAINTDAMKAWVKSDIARLEAFYAAAQAAVTA